ncbi:MAG TPA: tetratricopeptide repeat protein [Gemmatimonadaceae bacterium]|nr:tetratricopeptide repeat protein [Gemmatimonadaceae bacterium]
MTRYAWMTASVLAIATPTLAQGQQLTGTAKWADSASREIDAANASGDLNRLTTAAAMLDRVLTVTPNDPLLLYYRAFALYRTSTIYTGMKKTDEAKRVLDEADLLLEQATAKSPTAEALALRSAVMGLMIGSSGNPLSGMTLGPKAGGLLDRAKEMEPKNPRVWLISGMSAMFTPKMFGGGTDRAEQELRKAIALFETDRPAAPAPSWGRPDAFIWLGQALQKNDKIDEARTAYQKALELQPGNQWVQRVLLPSLNGTPKE